MDKYSEWVTEHANDIEKFVENHKISRPYIIKHRKRYIPKRDSFILQHYTFVIKFEEKKDVDIIWIEHYYTT